MLFWELLCWIHPWKWTAGTQELEGGSSDGFFLCKAETVHFPGCTKNIKKAGVDSEKGWLFLVLVIMEFILIAWYKSLKQPVCWIVFEVFFIAQMVQALFCWLIGDWFKVRDHASSKESSLWQIPSWQVNQCFPDHPTTKFLTKRINLTPPPPKQRSLP